MDTVRLVVDEARPGEENMARDLTLLEEGRPTLRLYAWDPPAVSLGRSQTRDVVDEAAARGLGVDIVQRATGGGAILHDATEVTYSIVLPHAWPGHPPDIPGSFRFLSLGIHRGLQALGLDPTFQQGTAGRDALCYLRRQGTNIVVDGRKVSGGAQRRTSTHVLQHGTVIVERQAQAMADLLGADVETVRGKVTSLRQEGVTAPREIIHEAIVRGYQDAWDVQLDPVDPATVAP